MSLSMYSSPYWNNPNFYNGGIQSQLNYMQNQAQNNLNAAYANQNDGDPAAAQSQIAYAQAKQNMMNGFNVNNAQSIQWGNGPLAAGGGNLVQWGGTGGSFGGSSGGASMGGGGGGGSASNDAFSSSGQTGWGTGNNGAPAQGVGYNSQGGQVNTYGTYNGDYTNRGVNIGDQSAGFNEGNYTDFWNGVPSETIALYPGGPGAALNRGVVTYDQQGNMIYPDGSSYTPISNAQGAASMYGGYKMPNSDYGAGGTGINSYGQGSGGFGQGGSTGASGFGGGSGGPMYRQIDSSGLMQGQMDGLMGYTPVQSNSPYTVSNYNNIFNSEMGGGSFGGGDD